MKQPLLLLIVLSAAACSTPTRTGWNAYEAGDWPRAMSAWQTVAEAGDADTQFLMGTLFEEGKGVRVDAQQAGAWYRLAAEQGHAAAQNNLGLLIFRGSIDGTPEEAATWFTAAADEDFAAAECNLGLMHLLGTGVEQDFERARGLLFLAARQSDRDAERLLGTLYDRGLGVEPRPDRAQGWYRRSAEQGNATARLQLGLLYLQGRGVPASESIAKRWIEPAAEVGLPEAEYALGWMLRHCESVLDPKQGALWVASAAEKDFAPAQAELGLMHLRGDSVAPDDALAAEWLRRSANQSFPIAEYNLALLYLEGRGVPRNQREATALIQRAAARGLPEAEARLETLAMTQNPGTKSLLASLSEPAWQFGLSH